MSDPLMAKRTPTISVGERDDGSIEIIMRPGDGLPLRLSEQDARDVVGMICAVKRWRVIDADGSRDECHVIHGRAVMREGVR